MLVANEAFRLLKERDMDGLEKELNNILDGYRFLNRAHEAAREDNDRLRKELGELQLQLIQLEADNNKLRQTKIVKDKIIQQTIDQSNSEAQSRMKEIEALREQVRALKGIE